MKGNNRFSFPTDTTIATKYYLISKHSSNFNYFGYVNILFDTSVHNIKGVDFYVVTPPLNMRYD